MESDNHNDAGFRDHSDSLALASRKMNSKSDLLEKLVLFTAESNLRNTAQGTRMALESDVPPYTKTVVA